MNAFFPQHNCTDVQKNLFMLANQLILHSKSTIL